MIKRIFFALIIMAMAPAASAISSSVSVVMPPTGTVDNTVLVTAYYANNSVFVPDATCTLSGGFLGSPATMTYSAGNSDYEYSLLLSSSGSQTFTVSCSKAGYETAQNTANIDIAKLGSSMYVDSTPSYTSLNIGSLFTFKAHYYSSGPKISGAACSMKVTTPSGSQDTVSMTEGADYYSAQYTLSSVGQYTFSADCSSNKYSSQSASMNVQSTKLYSQLGHATIASSYYIDAPITIMYYYTSDGTKEVADGTCTYEMRKDRTLTGSGALVHVAEGYKFSIPAPEPSSSSYNLKVSCNSGTYSVAQNDAYLYVREIPTSVSVISSTPKGAYSYAPVNISARYTDTRAGSKISDGECTVDFLDNHTAGSFYSATLPAVYKTEYEEARVCCSKKNYARQCGQATVVVSQQPISMDVRNLSSLLIVDTIYTVDVSARPAYYGGMDLITCSMDITDAKGGAPKKMALTNFGGEHKADVSFDNPGKYGIAVSCRGTGFSDGKTSYDTQVKMFTTSFESKLTTVLSALGVLLVAATILISKKYKI